MTTATESSTVADLITKFSRSIEATLNLINTRSIPMGSFDIIEPCQLLTPQEFMALGDALKSFNRRSSVHDVNSRWIRATGRIRVTVQLERGR